MVSILDYLLYMKQLHRYIVKTVSGSFITITDGIRANIVSFTSDAPNGTKVTVCGKNLLDLSKCKFNRCRNQNGVLTANIVEGYFATVTIDTPDICNAVLNSKGKSFTFSCNGIVPGRRMAIVLFGTRTGGSTYQEQNGYLEQEEVTIVVANDFTAISSIELRWARGGDMITDTTSTITNVQFELDNTATEYEAYREQTVTLPTSPTTLEIEPGVTNIFNDSGDSMTIEYKAATE